MADARALHGCVIYSKAGLEQGRPKGANKREASQEVHSFLLSISHFARVKFRVADSLSPNRGSWPESLPTGWEFVYFNLREDLLNFLKP